MNISYFKGFQGKKKNLIIFTRNTYLYQSLNRKFLTKFSKRCLNCQNVNFTPSFKDPLKSIIIKWRKCVFFACVYFKTDLICIPSCSLIQRICSYFLFFTYLLLIMTMVFNINYTSNWNLQNSMRTLKAHQVSKELLSFSFS